MFPYISSILQTMDPLTSQCVLPSEIQEAIFYQTDSLSRRASFFGKAHQQVATAADQIKNIPELQHGFDAIGLSQGNLYGSTDFMSSHKLPRFIGGQLLRALAEYHPQPPIRNLITVGSQHMGDDIAFGSSFTWLIADSFVSSQAFRTSLNVARQTSSVKPPNGPSTEVFGRCKIELFQLNVRRHLSTRAFPDADSRSSQIIVTK